MQAGVWEASGSIKTNQIVKISLLAQLSESALTEVIAGASGVDFILLCLSAPRRTKRREKLFLALKGCCPGYKNVPRAACPRYTRACRI